MSKRLKFDANDYFRAYVEHPRYGKLPRFTGLNHDPNRYGNFIHWHSNRDCRIPDTAILADITRQHPATVHVTHYYDVKRVCRDCKRQFLFFAEEQKYWYEELGFRLEADCVRCCDCRKIIQDETEESKAIQARYTELCHLDRRSPAEDLEWLELYCALPGMKAKQAAIDVLNRLAKTPEINRARWEECRRILKP